MLCGSQDFPVLGRICPVRLLGLWLEIKGNRNQKCHEEHRENKKPLIVYKRPHCFHQCRAANNPPYHQNLNQINSLLYDTGHRLHRIDKHLPFIAQSRRRLVDEIA